jgi:redox-sensitive bicupin YhaK (pirin superfamily)
MGIEFSGVVASRAHAKGKIFSVKSISVRELGERASPLIILDHFWVRGHPFGIHPHAGFSAVAYVLENSPGAVRSRDSLGGDAIMAPGGLVWTVAGSGLVHEDFPADTGREIHGVQIFVNLSSKNKTVPPRVLRLPPDAVPVWRSDGGDRVRVLVGSFQGLSSPLVPPEPFTLLDASLKYSIAFDVPASHNAIVYVLDGNVEARSEDGTRTVEAEHALAMRGVKGGGRALLKASAPVRLLVLAGAEISEPVVIDGTAFVMNTQSEIEAAAARFRAGEMGHLEPLAAD